MPAIPANSGNSCPTLEVGQTMPRMAKRDMGGTRLENSHALIGQNLSHFGSGTGWTTCVPLPPNP